MHAKARQLGSAKGVRYELPISRVLDVGAAFLRWVAGYDSQLSKEKCSSLSHYYDVPTTPGFKPNADGSECPIARGACRTPMAGAVVMKDGLNTGD
jgi:hypothetical protein